LSKISYPSKLVIVVGPIEYWWEERWGTPEHAQYVAWREAV
jgi:hypothetical protein